MATATPMGRRWPAYRAIWRWHFYAGLFCIPFVLWLAATGTVYLFKPQIEALIDRPYAQVAGPGPRASAAAQAAAAVRAVPGSVLHRYQLPDSPAQAVQVIVGRGATETRVYVHPQTLAILKRVDEDARLMRIVSRLHGELMAGAVGSWLVELAASWAIVIILSGLILWWPRGGGLAGVIYPRLRAGGRRFWRDLHGITGFWVSAMALFLLLSGLPWATSWGAYLKAVRGVVEQGTVGQDWSTGRAGEARARAVADAGTRAMMGDHVEHGGMTMAHVAPAYAALDRVAEAVHPLRLAPPVLIAPPTAPDAPWTAKSDTANRPLRSDLTIDGATGGVLTRRDFAERRLVDQLVGYGIAVHEGALFGWVNQLLNLLTAVGLVLVTVSGATMWWRRRPAGAVGAPPARPAPPVAIGFVATLVLLGLLLPLFGASLVLVLLLDRLAGQARPRMRR